MIATNCGVWGRMPNNDRVSYADTVHGASHFAARYARFGAQHDKPDGSIAKAQQAWRRQQLSTGAPTPGTDSRETCYICLGSEGCMLVNVCKCRSRVHQSCLSTMVKHNGCSVCTVCKSVLEYPCEPSTELLELLYRTYPCAMLAYALFSILVGFAALCVVVWSSIYMEESSTTTILCALVLGYSMINTVVIFHHRPVDQPWRCGSLFERQRYIRSCMRSFLQLLMRLTRVVRESYVQEHSVAPAPRAAVAPRFPHN